MLNMLCSAGIVLKTVLTVLNLSLKMDFLFISENKILGLSNNSFFFLLPFSLISVKHSLPL